MQKIKYPDFLLTNIIFTAYKITERHYFLENTIGYLEKEQESFLAVRYILFGSLAYIVIGSILEGYCFFLYNEKFHPFNKILLPNDEIEVQNVSEILTLIYSPTNATKVKPTFWNGWNNLKHAIHMTDDKPREKYFQKKSRAEKVISHSTNLSIKSKSSNWKKWNNIKNAVFMTDDKPKQDINKKSAKQNSYCKIFCWTTAVIFLVGLIIAIIILGMGLNITRGKEIQYIK